ncbi:MAG: DUF1643 domain-containing protein [Ktedonobacterales bacterium]
MTDPDQIIALSDWSKRTLSHTSEDGPPAVYRRGAVIAGDYRYLLWRGWDDTLPCLLWVMLNPSTAGEERNDPTIRRCMGFSRRWGYGGLEVVNLFALLATHWVDLRRAVDPIGPENDRYIAEAATRATGIVVAWGEHGGYLGRDRAILALLSAHSAQPLYCLGVVRNGRPRHPLYAAGNSSLVEYRANAR